MSAARVTLREVAELAGVNPATVSRVLNDHTRHLVKRETATRVATAARQLGYEPNRLARSLRMRRSYSIGVVIPDLTNPFFPPMVRGIEDALAPAGYTALLTNTDGEYVRERRMFEALRGRQVDGFIMTTAATSDSLVADAMAAGVPLVLVNRTFNRDDGFAVLSDDRPGMQQAVDHLLALGHSAIGHVAGPQQVSTGVLRHRAFVDALAARGLEVDDDAIAVAAAFNEQAGAVAARRLLTARPDCTAVIAANDLIALGVYRAATDLARQCPTKLSVVGFNDMPFADKFAPPLTTVHVPVYELGRRSAQLLLERIENEAASPRTILLETQLVVRGSTAPPP
jgi:LacI family transcriptional regulator